MTPFYDIWKYFTKSNLLFSSKTFPLILIKLSEPHILSSLQPISFRSHHTIHYCTLPCRCLFRHYVHARTPPHWGIELPLFTAFAE